MMRANFYLIAQEGSLTQAKRSREEEIFKETTSKLI
jgi:hypothetical protein